MSSSAATVAGHHSPHETHETVALQQPRPLSSGAVPGLSLPFDPIKVVDAIYACRWHALAAAVIGAGIMGVLASLRLETRHTATAQLIKLAPQNSLRQSERGDPYTPHEVTIPNMVAIMWSGPVIEGAVERLAGSVSEGTLRNGLAVSPERNTDIIHVSINSDESRATSLSTLDAYIDEVLEFSRQIQQHDAAAMVKLLNKEITQADQEIDKFNLQLLDYSKKEDIVDPDKQTDALLGEIANLNLRYQEVRLDYETLDLRIGEIEAELAKVSPIANKLEDARENLAALRIRYTDKHPTLQNAIAAVAALEAEASAEMDAPARAEPPRPGENTIAESLYLDLVILRGEKRALAEQLSKLSEVKSQAESRLDQLPRKTIEIARMKARRQAAETSRNLLSARLREAMLVEESAEGAFRLLSKDRLDDVGVTSPLKKTILAAGAGFTGGAGLVCLLVAASTLARSKVGSAYDLKRLSKLPLLAKAEQSVLENPGLRKEWAFTSWTTISPKLKRKSSEHALLCGLVYDRESVIPGLLAEAAARRGSSALVISRRKAKQSIGIGSAIRSAEKVVRALTERPERILHLHLEDEWSWDTDQRARLKEALQTWEESSQLVIFIELSDPGSPGDLLVSEELPNIIWIARSENNSSAVSEKIRLYRSAGCALSGVVLESAPSYRLPLLKHFEKFLAVLALSLVSIVTTSYVSASELALLGPGDQVNINFIGQPELSRKGVTISPDGTLTYLQAQSISVSGLSIDGVRKVLNFELGEYYQNARISVTPLLFRSNRAYVLGKIVKKGAISLDRPMSITDVVAEAGGLETGLFQQNTVELADLRRSFLVRQGQKVSVDFEALFFKGDMTQNLLVRNGDYIYFPSANSNDIHVFGNVKMQGTQGLLAHTSVHSAIAQAGGFTDKAYRDRILVIRGSLESPDTFVVDMDAILAGREVGFRLEPKDIVYIADHPWARAEELLAMALDTFCRGAVSSWAGVNVGPLIHKPLLPQR